MERMWCPFKFLLSAVLITILYSSLISSHDRSSDAPNKDQALTLNDSLHPGHLKPFGSAGPFERTDDIDGYPSPAEFFPYHVFVRRPLKMIGAGRLSPAFSLWTDEYLQSLDSTSMSYSLYTLSSFDS